MIPLLITMDLELARDHDMKEQEQILSALRRDMAVLGSPITVFCTSDSGEAFAPEVRKLARAGHEIACHGMTHGPQEDFSRMGADETRRVLTEATSRIEALPLPRPRCFRGPGMTTSTTTQQCLIESGYIADFSVCPQRFDFFLTKGGNIGWLSAPRTPYFSAMHSPYRCGSLPLMVVPLSCLGLPFISGVHYLFGLRFMKFFYRMLISEARWRGAPIVYLFHSYEFATYRESSGYKRPFHHEMYLRDPALRYSRHTTLLKHMLSDPDVVPMTASDFVRHAQREMSHETLPIQ